MSAWRVLGWIGLAVGLLALGLVLAVWLQPAAPERQQTPRLRPVRVLTVEQAREGPWLAPGRA